MKTQLIAGMVFMLVAGLTATAQTAPAADTEAVRINDEVEQAPPVGQEPKSEQVAPRDDTRGENAPRNGRGMNQGQGYGPRDGTDPN